MLSESQIQRYARHILLPQIGGKGQQKLLDARMLLIGIGGLGSATAMYLAAAGVGTIGLVDHDVVELSNLQRQIIHATGDIGRLKTDSAAEAIRALNPDVTVERHPAACLDVNAALALFEQYDIILDGTDDPKARFLINDAAFLARKPLVSAAIARFEGLLSIYKPHAGGPCLRCLFPKPPPADHTLSCADAGILGPVAGVMGTLQAVEAVKELLGVGQSLQGRLLIYDALASSTRTVALARDPQCPVCAAPSSRRHIGVYNGRSTV